MEIKELLQRTKPLQEQLTAWRRDFHRHPETGYEEFRTSAIVAEHLEKLGLEVTRNVGGTGVVGLLRGEKPGPTIGCGRTWTRSRSRIRRRRITARR